MPLVRTMEPSRISWVDSGRRSVPREVVSIGSPLPSEEDMGFAVGAMCYVDMFYSGKRGRGGE